MRISDWSSDVCSSDLIERKGAALAGAIDVGERNRRSRKFGCIRAVTVAGCAMAARTILGEKGRSTGKVGHSGWSERDRIGFEQIAGETMGKNGNLAWWVVGGNDRHKRKGVARGKGGSGRVNH